MQTAARDRNPGDVCLVWQISSKKERGVRESFAGIKSTNPLLDSPNSNTMGSRLPLREENGGIQNERFHSSSSLKADKKGQDTNAALFDAGVSGFPK